jgi:hypothetical protein
VSTSHDDLETSSESYPNHNASRRSRGSDLSTDSIPQPKIASPAKIAANQRNAKKSTGPRTAQGRPEAAGTRASMDSWRSVLFAREGKTARRSPIS